MGADEDVRVPLLARQGFEDFEGALRRGTRCSRPAFILAAGTTQTFPFRSISDHLAPITSPVRAAVRMVNSNARA